MELTATKYRQTEVGLIPEDWACMKIGSITNASAGGTPNTKIKEYWGGTIPWMNSGELNLKHVHDVENRISEEGLSNSSTKYIPIFSVLIGLAGQGKTRGTAALNHIKLCTNQSIAAIYPSKKHDSFYLYYYLDSLYTELRKLSTGDGGRGGLNLHIIKNILVPLPTLTEQKAIAQVLSDTDALIQALAKKIAKKKLIKKGVMQKLLMPKEDWVTKKISEISSITGAGVDKKINEKEHEVKLLNYMDVFKKDYLFQDMFSHEVTAPLSKLSSCNVLKGDIFLTPSSEMRTDIGISALAMENMEGIVYSYHVNRLRYTVDIDIKFGLYILKTRNFLKQVETLCEGSGKRYVLSLTKFKELEITYPDNKAEQQRISEIIYSIDSELDQLENKLEKYKLAKQGIMQQLLTGKIRIL